METDNWFGFMRSWKNKSTKVFIQNASLLMDLEQKYPARQSAAFIERVEQSSKRGQRCLRGWEETSCSYTGLRDVCLSLMLSWASQQWEISRERTPAATVGRTLTQVMPVKKAIATRCLGNCNLHHDQALFWGIRSNDLDPRAGSSSSF